MYLLYKVLLFKLFKHKKFIYLLIRYHFTVHWYHVHIHY